ncbi:MULTISPECIES: hypothetical protein [Bacillus]|uniref:hypothetical protein n=1 Tax=Bacillus TaxID=1386 RepID=UPI001428993C|nr:MULTISPECIES: hypothetical protein [Bacillus]
MPIGKQLKQKLANTNAFEKKHNEFLEEIKEFKNNKELQNEYKRVQDTLKEREEETKI